jgi:recombination protein RecA
MGALPLPAGIVRAARIGTGTRIAPAPASWTFDDLAGRFVELSGLGNSACLSMALGVVLDAQRSGEPAAWVTRTDSCFYPPDAAASGLDLEALAVIRVPGNREIVRAADRLSRSGAFGIVVLDLGAGSDPATALGRGRPARVSMAMQSRLRGLAQRHDMVVLCLTRKPERQASIGSLISLRGEPLRERDGEDHFLCTLHALKDKQRGPGWSVTESFRGPEGLH